MTVKEILINVAYLLDDEKLVNSIENDSFSGNLENEKALLVKCVNYVNNIIATEYFHIDDSIEINNQTGIIPFSKITTKTIFDIVEVKSSFGHSLSFKVNSNGLETKKGKVKIKYLYMPDEVSYSDTIDCYKTKINARIFAYGVASEYLFIKGNFDDGDLFDNRFKNSLQSILRKHKDLIMPVRRWE